jgi:hypothetical protein
MKNADTRPDVVFCLSFGKRANEASPSNKFLIEKIVRFYQDSPLPLIIQKDCADYFSKDIKIDKIISNHIIIGKYLDTREVLRQCVEHCVVHRFKKALIFAHPDHLPRIKRELNHFNFKFELADTIGCPYDPKSSQIWTRNKTIFLLREVLVRWYYIIKRV